ncbi:MAG: aminodeoxychorismate synthase component I [Steroidobacteraceae bacterium]
MTSRAAWPEDALLGLHSRFPDRYPVLLESVGGEPPLGRYDVLMALPGDRLLRHPDGRLEGPVAADHVRFLDALDDWWRTESVAAPSGAIRAPFEGGWFVYAGYELASEIEPTLELPWPRHPSAIAWRMHGAIVRDRSTGEVVFRAGYRGRDLEAQALSDFATIGTGATGPDDGLVAGDIEEDPPLRFTEGVERVLEAIARGDVYQANLSRGWRARLAPGATAARLYGRLRRANPAPFAGIAALPGFTLLSSSPERLIRIERRCVSTRPIAGTRPRGATSRDDESMKRDLVLNEKERAEHVMLVDLERNDLGRICVGGSVEVDEFMTVESYATVHHIVSNVRGRLRDDVTPGQAIAAVFPGGTITGCPKVRCMQILAELERGPRDAYTGSMGYLGLDGSLDMNILIRTLTVADGVVAFRAGAGIVADSQPAAELAESRAKARGMLRALGGGT